MFIHGFPGPLTQIGVTLREMYGMSEDDVADAFTWVRLGYSPAYVTDAVCRLAEAGLIPDVFDKERA